MNSAELLARYRETESEEAFAEIVQRYADLVFSVAKRQLGSIALAEEAAQVVFVRLAQARPRLLSDQAVLGWLHRTALHVSIDSVRSETRRQAREKQSMELRSINEDAAWQELGPFLDRALDKLKEDERGILLLRFFGAKPFSEIGAAFRISEDAAKMRVGRALEKLRDSLAGQKVYCATPLLGTLLTSHSVESSPLRLIDRLTAIQRSLPAPVGRFHLPLTRLLLGTGTMLLLGILLAAERRLHHAAAPVLAPDRALSTTVSNSRQFAVNGTYKLKFDRAPAGDAVRFSSGLKGLEGLRPSTGGSFSIEVEDCQWRIRLEKLGAAVTKADYQECTYDGRYIYDYFCYEKWQAARKKFGLRSGSNNGEAKILKGMFPYVEDEIIRVLWYLYCSKCYLAEHTQEEQLIPVTFHSSMNLEHFGFTQRSARTLNPLSQLPDFIAFFHDGQLRQWANEDLGYTAGPPEVTTWDTPYDKGFTNATLAVSLRGPQSSLPKSASFTVFAPVQRATNASQLRFLREITVEASYVTNSLTTTSFRPEIKGETVTGDQRFASPEYPGLIVGYTSEGDWLSEEAVKARPEYQSAIKNFQMLKSMAEQRR